ncbi:polysaccharide biosynthesis protein [Bacillus amyloliquefaciens]
MQTNLIGGQNVAEAALLQEVTHVINISTDKAVY